MGTAAIAAAIAAKTAMEEHSIEGTIMVLAHLLRRLYLVKYI